MNEFETLQAENNQLKAQCTLLLLLLSGNKLPLTPTEIFASRLKQARKAAGLTQEKIAPKVGLTKNGYALYETAKREPSLSTLVAIADEFDVSVDWLLGRTNDIRR